MTLTVHTPDRRRKLSLGMSVVLHLLLFFGPLLLSLIHSAMPAVFLPKGSGTPDAGDAAAAASTTSNSRPDATSDKPKDKNRVTPRRRNLTGLILLPSAGDDRARSMLAMFADALSSTENRHVASNVPKQVNASTMVSGKSRKSGKKPGKFGKGGIGDGGFPDGAFGGSIPFVRIEYDGKDWDDGRDPADAADANFLSEFNDITKLPTASDGQAIRISQLKNYPQGHAPPFVFITGSEEIRIPAQDMQSLRDYVNAGGMIFADCGSVRWGAAFHDFIGKLLPDSPLVEIADDDIIYLEPFEFPNGSPKLWHHGGERAQGCKHNGRWIVFYFPGDMNDAWKNVCTDHAVKETAVELGTNVVYYAVTQYLAETRQLRK